MLVQTYVLESECHIPREQERFSFVLTELSRLDENYETFKVRMIDRMQGFAPEERERLRLLYHELSLYAHPSLKQMDLDSIPVPPLDFEKPDFELCVRLMLEVTDLMVAVAIELSPGVATILIEWLDRTASWKQMELWRMCMTLGRCSSKNNRPVRNGGAKDSKTPSK